MTDRDPEGRTALHRVTLDLPAERHGEETLRLLRAGLDPGARDRQGWTALHFAAQSWSAEAARVLLAHGAEVDRADAYGNTPLWRAVFASEGRGGLIELLLRAGADPDRANAHGVSPRALAERIGNYDVARFFRTPD